MRSAMRSEVTEPTEKIGIHIDASESVEERAVIVEMAEVAESPSWYPKDRP